MGKRQLVLVNAIFFLKEAFWSIHLESLLQSTQETSKSPPSSLLPQAQKENQDSVSVNVIMRSEQYRKSAPCYKKPQKAFFSFCLWPHPYHTHNLSTTLESFPPFPFLTLPSGSQLAAGSSQHPQGPQLRPCRSRCTLSFFGHWVKFFATAQRKGTLIQAEHALDQILISDTHTIPVVSHMCAHFWQQDMPTCALSSCISKSGVAAFLIETKVYRNDF